MSRRWIRILLAIGIGVLVTVIGTKRLADQDPNAVGWIHGVIPARYISPEELRWVLRVQQQHTMTVLRGARLQIAAVALQLVAALLLVGSLVENEGRPSQPRPPRQPRQTATPASVAPRPRTATTANAHR